MELPSPGSNDAAFVFDPPRLSPTFADPARHYPSPTKEDAGHNTTGMVKFSEHYTGMASTTKAMVAYAADSGSGSVLPGTLTAAPRSVALVGKPVTFELLLGPETPDSRARLPLRVKISPHDTTESIVTTVKNFYGLYSSQTVSKGVSFEDSQGNTLIARYENFNDAMTVYVRVIEEPTQPLATHSEPRSMVGVSIPAQSYHATGSASAESSKHSTSLISRPSSRASPRRSSSPSSSRGCRSDSTGTQSKKARSRSSKTRGPGSDHGDSFNGYSSGDGAPGSTSGRNKDQIGNTEISLDNIVEGGRRKRAKFESSELPLFAPPQMPAATSNASVSPARRAEPQQHSLPNLLAGQNPFTNPRPLQSPQSYCHGYGQSGLYATPAPDSRRSRGSLGYAPGPGFGPGSHMVPTPDPTIGSCVSEEDKDVAMQLMRLGDMSNISHGRTSASTLDDTFSGRADAASSTGATSDADSEDEDNVLPARRQRLDLNSNYRKMTPTYKSQFGGPQSADASGDDADCDHGRLEGSMAAPPPRTKNQKAKAAPLNGTSKLRPQALASKGKAYKTKPKAKSKSAGVLGPMSPTSLPASSRKPSIASTHSIPMGPPGNDEQPDLSTKPRCQRCRKSKKGCDRQRPCGRCRDAGLPAEMCISEDEGNGRKGRYGRHMGVPIQRDEVSTGPLSVSTFSSFDSDGHALLAPATIATIGADFVAGTASDKNKKRKR